MQYLHWIGGLLHGDLGYSYVSEKPALDEILPRIPITAQARRHGAAVLGLIGVPLGVISAVQAEHAARLCAARGQPERPVAAVVLARPADPDGVRALFGTMPIYNRTRRPGRGARVYCVPATAVGFRSSALMMRLTRSSMLEVLRQDYIRTARAKGASECRSTIHHALRNAVLPVVTVIGIEAAFLIGGLIVTETVFNIPGVARFLVEAIRWRDYPIVQNLVMFIAFVVVIVNFLVDMLYAALDPRIKLRGLRSHGAIGRRSTTIAELRRAGAHADAWLAPAGVPRRSAIRSAPSACIIMVVFVLVAVFAD